MRELVAVVVVALGCKGSAPERSSLRECFDLCVETRIALVESQRRGRVADAAVPDATAVKARASGRASDPLADILGAPLPDSAGKKKTAVDPWAAHDAARAPLPDSAGKKKRIDPFDQALRGPPGVTFLDDGFVPDPPSPLSTPEQTRDECARLCIARTPAR